MEALRDIIKELIAALVSLVDAAHDPDGLQALLKDLGWSPTSALNLPPELSHACSELLRVYSADEELSTIELVNAVKGLVEALIAMRTKPDGAFPSGIDVASFKATIGRDLLDYLFVEHLLRHRYKVGDLLKLAGLIRLVETPATGLRQAYLKREVVWSRIGDLLTDPAQGFREAFDWNSAAPKMNQVLIDFASLCESYDLRLSYFEATGDLLTFVNTGVTPPIEGLLGIDLAFANPSDAPDGFDAGVRLLLLPPTANRGPAISFFPYASLKGAKQMALSDTTSLSIAGDADFTKGVAIILAPGRAPEVQAGFLGGMAVSPADIQLGLKFTPPPDEPERRLIGAPDGSGLAIKTAGFFFGARLVSADQLDTFVGIEVENARVVIKPAAGEADAFLESLLGKDGISLSLTFGLRLSSITGFHLTGSSRLEGTFPAHANFGPIAVQSLALGLKPNQHGLEFAAGATVTGNIGPLAIAIEGVGFRLNAQFPDPPTGNLGPIDADFGFKPPSGIAITIDTDVVAGGGYLIFEPEKHRYAGAMVLEIGNVTVSAVGLLTTRLPDGREGFSLLISLSASGFTPIQLGLGFTLIGMGGLLGLNRRADAEVLRAGLKNKTLDAVLFPADPLARLPQLVNVLERVFPVAEGRYLIGPAAIIGWGTPTRLTLELALILELPAPVRLIILGQLRAFLPTEAAPILRLKMDALGVVDFEQGEVSLDATLYESRLMQFGLSGDMALRARWESDPGFVLAVGGLNPRFNPPAALDFPKLKRITIDFTRRDNPRLRLSAYLALTSNTLQIGARAELYIGISALSVQGAVGFDVLIRFSPFGFVADVSGEVAVKWGSHTLLGISLEASLSGPDPLVIRGKGKVKIWIFSKSFDFDHTLGDADTPPPLPAANPLPDLVAALQDPRSWSAQLPGGGHMLVALRQLEVAPGVVLAHPLGTLTVTQTVVPLNLTIDRYSGATLAGDRRFSIGPVSLGDDDDPPVSLVRDWFAPGEYLDLSDTERLSRPSFERMDAGLRIGADEVAYGGGQAGQETLMTTAAITYETKIIGPDGQEVVPGPSYTPDPVKLSAAVALGAVARKGIAHAGRARYYGPRGGVEMVEPGYAVASAETLHPAGDTVASFSAAVEALTVLQAVATHAEEAGEVEAALQVVGGHVLKGALT